LLRVLVRGLLLVVLGCGVSAVVGCKKKDVKGKKRKVATPVPRKKTKRPSYIMWKFYGKSLYKTGLLATEPAGKEEKILSEIVRLFVFVSRNCKKAAGKNINDIRGMLILDKNKVKKVTFTKKDQLVECFEQEISGYKHLKLKIPPPVTAHFLLKK